MAWKLKLYTLLNIILHMSKNEHFNYVSVTKFNNFPTIPFQVTSRSHKTLKVGFFFIIRECMWALLHCFDAVGCRLQKSADWLKHVSIIWRLNARKIFYLEWTEQDWQEQEDQSWISKLQNRHLYTVVKIPVWNKYYSSA